MKLLLIVALVALTFIAFSFQPLTLTPVEAQSPPTWQADSLKSEIYFGSDMGDNTAVSQEAWEGFVADVVVPRFPAGIT